MPITGQNTKWIINVLTRFLPIMSFVIPLAILYSLYPYSFEQAYQGRTLQLFFLWLTSLEIVLGWENLQNRKIGKLRSKRTVLFIVSLLLPTIYIIAANYYGVNLAIERSFLPYLLNASWDPVPGHFARLMPVSFEYLVFAIFLCLMVLLAHGINDLSNFSISIFFSGIIGTIFAIDNLYPVGRFTPFQILVPTSATLAANALSLIGYRTSLIFVTDPIYGYMPLLSVVDPENPIRRASFYIAWQCAGVESLLIYTVTILLFLRGTKISWKMGAVYFAVGAIVTYFINIFRILSIFLIAMDYGSESSQFASFHAYYGPLYSIIWIVSYPLIVIGSRILWGKIRSRKGTVLSPSKEKG